MSLPYFLQGLIIGFSIAAPVGPIGILCIRRSLAEGRAAGLVSGLGAATADAIYGCIAGFGLTLISDFLLGQRIWLHFIGGVFLFVLGLKTFLSKPAEQATVIQEKGLVGAYASTFFLTLTNPMTILSFAAVFAGLGLTGTGNYMSAGVLVMGVFMGSALWWLMLSGGVGVFKKKFNRNGLLWINRISGVIITGFGLFALMNSLR